MRCAMHELTELHDSPVFLRREAMDFGYTDKNLRAALRERHVVRIRQGTYTTAAVWQEADEVERHRLRAAGVLLTHGQSVMLSHTSAAIEHGLRLWAPNLDKVHVTRLDGAPGRTSGDVVYHQGRWTPDDVHLKADRLMVGALRSGLETAALHTVEQGMCVLDSVLDLDHADPEQLGRAARTMLTWPNSRRLQMSVRLARVGAESVGESRSRFLCWEQGLPEPELQFEVRDGPGEPFACVDLAWPSRGLLGEFDGKVKYTRLLKPGQDPGDVVFLEKQREDRIREVTGMSMVRLTWADLRRRRDTAARIRSRMSRLAS